MRLHVSSTKCSKHVEAFNKPIIKQEEVHQLFTDFKKACDSVRREILCKILIDYGIPGKLVRLIKMSLKHIAESG